MTDAISLYYNPSLLTPGTQATAEQLNAELQKIKAAFEQVPPPTSGGANYTWIAFARSADGTDDFTTGEPGTRPYLGLSPNHSVATPSQNPGDYRWVKIGGQAGQAAPQLRVQWSVNGVSDWHDDYELGDFYQRQSVDNGMTYGPAYRVVGEGQGEFVAFIFARGVDKPPRPQDDAGNPPPGASDGPFDGPGNLWMSNAKFRDAEQLEPWSEYVQINGPKGDKGDKGDKGSGGGGFSMTLFGSASFLADDAVSKIGAGSDFDSGFYTNDGYTNACRYEARPNSNTVGVYMGFIHPLYPATPIAREQVSFAWGLGGDGYATRWGLGLTPLPGGTAYNPGDVFALEYTGSYVIFLRNGVEVAREKHETTLPFYGCAIMNVAGAGVNTIRWERLPFPGYEIVSVLPGLGNYKGRLVYLETDEKLYRYGAGGWSRAVDGADILANSILTNSLGAGVVTAAKISVSRLDALTGTIGLLRTRADGQRSELSDNGLNVFNFANVNTFTAGIY